MNEPMDLETTIEDAVNDSVATPEVDTDTSVDVSPDTSVDTSDVTADTPVDTGDPVAPGAKAPADAVADDFANRFGLQSTSVTGRENRIPYSRVKKIIEKNEKDTAARVTKEVESKLAPRVAEFETRVKDYEGRLERVGQFENILQNDPKTFLQMLSNIPAYKQFFDFVSHAVTALDAQAPAQPEKPFLDQSGMPQPDQTLSDGSRVYSLEGLAKRDEWLARQIEEKAVRQAEERISKRYQPLEQAWQSQEQYNRIVPVVEKQIADARTWPHFSENEPAIVAALKADPNISLEGAYRQVLTNVVLPNIQPNRDRMRQEILDEIKKRPVSSTAPTGQTRPRPAGNTGAPRSLEEIIASSIEESGLK